MSFPTVGQTAFVATTTTGAVSICSVIAATKSQNTTQTVAFGVLGIISGGLSLGFTSAYMRSNARTTPREYLNNGLSGAGHVVAATTTGAAQIVTQAVIQQVTHSIGKEVGRKMDEYFNPKKKTDDSK